MTNTYYTYSNLKKDFSEEDLQKFLLQEGYTYRDLQHLYKYNERLWSRYAKECNIPKQPCNIQRRTIERCTKSLPMDEIVDLYLNHGASLRDIAHKYNVTHGTIAKKLHDKGIDIRSFNHPTYYDNRRGSTGKINVDTFGYIHEDGDRQHRNVMRKKLQRPLTHIEAVHHMDKDRTNNNEDNLFIFPDNRCHILYHGQHWTEDPNEFTRYYQDVLLNTLYDATWLYKQYITLRKSVAQISRELKVGRTAITKSLKNFNIYDIRSRSINQYDCD